MPCRPARRATAPSPIRSGGAWRGERVLIGDVARPARADHRHSPLLQAARFAHRLSSSPRTRSGVHRPTRSTTCGLVVPGMPEQVRHDDRGRGDVRTRCPFSGRYEASLADRLRLQVQSLVAYLYVTPETPVPDQRAVAIVITVVPPIAVIAIGV